MAVHVTLELTDAQWALIVEHGGETFQIPDTEEDGVYTPVTITADIIVEELRKFLTKKITRQIQNKAQTAQADAFDV